MSRRKYRVVQWATGRVGLPALQGVINHPDLELVGVYVTSAAKAGRDAGDLVGAAPIGVAATDDRRQILDLDADCVVYTATDVDRVDEVIDDLVAVLASGKNVVNTSVTGLVRPAGMEPAVVDRLQQACATGGSTLFSTGIHPGVIGGQLLSALSNFSQGIETVTVSQHIDVSTYDPAVLAFFGMGLTADEDARQFDPEVVHFYWGPVLDTVAEMFGLHLDEVRLFRHPELVTDGATLANGMTVRPNTIGALHYGLQGVVDDRVRVVVENYNKITPYLPSAWPSFPRYADVQTGGHRITVSGNPAMQLDQSFGNPTDPLRDVLVATGMCAVNAVVDTVEAPSGVVPSFAALPHLHGFPNP